MRISEFLIEESLGPLKFRCPPQVAVCEEAYYAVSECVLSREQPTVSCRFDYHAPVLVLFRWPENPGNSHEFVEYKQVIACATCKTRSSPRSVDNKECINTVATLALHSPALAVRYHFIDSADQNGSPACCGGVS